MHLKELRERHKILHYHSFTIVREKEYTLVRFEFELEPGITFRPQLVVEACADIDDEQLSVFAFHVGLAELASYWKCACPKEIKISAGYLSPEQCSWWHDLLMHGMGEFYFQNQIDFTRPEFLKISSSPGAPNFSAQAELAVENGCILAAGGKDSSLTLELLKDYTGTLNPLILNPSRAALESANIAGFRNPIIMRRTIDSTLLSLNTQGYLNGHTPFSSYLGFASLFAAAVAGRKDIIVSNERSANQENIVYHDMPINHQYSKSFRFESMFRDYYSEHLSSKLNYFSFIRPLYDLQVAGLFAKHCTAHFRSFRSCNVGSRRDSWCGSCPKCAFTYIALAAFVTPEKLQSIYGRDITLDPQFEEHLRGLIGLSAIKPFECVGTTEESLQALRLAISRNQNNHSPAVELLGRIAKEASNLESDEISLSSISNEHFVPQEYFVALEDALYVSFPDE